MVFTEIYIAALLTDQAKADAVWQLWFEGWIDDDLAVFGWLILGPAEAMMSAVTGLVGVDIGR